jgi:hypothetical protein
MINILLYKISAFEVYLHEIKIIIIIFKYFLSDATYLVSLLS